MHEIQRLGWLSSHSRQILLARHALRTFDILADRMAREAGASWGGGTAEFDALEVLRALIEILSGANQSTGRLAAPYTPKDRPTTFFLSVARKGNFLSVGTQPTDTLNSLLGTHFSRGGLAVSGNASWVGVEPEGPTIDILADEIAQVRKGVDLSSKAVADRRCDELVARRVWPPFLRGSWQAEELFRPFNSVTNGAFRFWREWYQGFLDGKPLDWELQRRVALIPDSDWALGPEHIAEKIEEIRREFEGASAQTPKRHEALEPRSVDRVLQSPQISAAQLESAARVIEDARCRYLNDTGANDLPEAFQALPGVAQGLTAVAAVVRRHSDTGSVEQELREEVGRLNAQVLALETELAKAKATKDPVFWKAFKEQAGKSLGDWKLYGSLVGAVWFVSGDVAGLQERLENLGTLWRGFSEAVGAPSDTPIASPPLTTDV